MSKKILSVMLALVMVMSVFSIVSFAGVNSRYETFDEDTEAYAQKWSLETTNEADENGKYTVNVVLETNYGVGAISLPLVVEGATLESAAEGTALFNADGYNADVQVDKTNNIVYIVPDPATEGSEAPVLAAGSVVATLTFALTADTATVTLLNDAKTADNAGSLIAARPEDGLLACNTVFYGQLVMDADGNEIALGDEIASVTLGQEAVATYTVSFDANGGTGEMADVVMEAGDYVLPENGFTAATGYAFKAWDVNGTEYAAGATVAIAADTTVKAVWEMLTPVLSGANTSVVIDTNKTFGGTYKGAIYGFTSSRYNGASLKGQLVVENGTITVTGNGTGAKIEVFDLAGNLYETYVAVVFGDVDGTGTINTNDVAALKNSIGGTDKLVANTPEYMAANLASSFNRAHNTNDLATLKNRVSSTSAFTQSAMGANHTYSN